MRPDRFGQVVVGHYIRVEIHLDLSIQGNDPQGGGQVFDEEFLGFVQVIDVGVAVSQVVISSTGSSAMKNTRTAKRE